MDLIENIQEHWLKYLMGAGILGVACATLLARERERTLLTGSINQDLGHGATAVPDYMPKTKRRKAEGTYVYPRMKKFPIGDLYHARLALIMSLWPSNAPTRPEVLSAVARRWPKYNWASWWDEHTGKKKGKKGQAPLYKWNRSIR